MGGRFEAGKLEFDPFAPRRRRFIYRDNNAGGKIVFECLAEGILEADKMYQEQTGRDVVKQSHIGCSTEELDETPDAAKTDTEL